MNRPAVKPVRTTDSLTDRSQMARRRAKTAVMLARAVDKASRELDRKIDAMLVQLEFRLAVSRADDPLKQRGLELIANSLKNNGRPSKDAMLNFISEAKKTA